MPKVGPVESYAAQRAALDRRTFIDQLGGAGVLIRLDERGGDDEPAPWAFHGSGLPLPVDVPSSDEDVFLDRTREQQVQHARVDADESTLTGPTFSISVPAARGRATLHVVPNAADVSVGRGASCQVRIAERSVSKRHARLLIAQDGEVTAASPGRSARPRFAIADATSRNGVAVNGKPVAAAELRELRSGDVIELGDVSLLFLDAGELYDGLPRLTDG